jgi:hypothetical protein
VTLSVSKDNIESVFLTDFIAGINYPVKHHEIGWSVAKTIPTVPAYPSQYDPILIGQ